MDYDSYLYLKKDYLSIFFLWLCVFRGYEGDDLGLIKISELSSLCKQMVRVMVL